jgi:hypothetical protein
MINGKMTGSNFNIEKYSYGAFHQGQFVLPLLQNLILYLIVLCEWVQAVDVTDISHDLSLNLASVSSSLFCVFSVASLNKNKINT